MTTSIYLLLSVFLVSKSHWLFAWSIFKLIGCLLQIMYLKSFGAGSRPGVFAGLEPGRATKPLWLGDSSNTAKQLVLPGESSVGRSRRHRVLGPAGNLRGWVANSGPREAIGLRGAIADPPHPTSAFYFLLPRHCRGLWLQCSLGTAASGTGVSGSGRLGFLIGQPHTAGKGLDFRGKGPRI